MTLAPSHFSFVQA